MDREHPTFTKFMSILNDITKATSKTEEDKTRTYWEKSLIDSWERLIDRSEERNFDFFVIKENLLIELKSIQRTFTSQAAEGKPNESIKEEEKGEGKLMKELQGNY